MSPGPCVKCCRCLASCAHCAADPMHNQKRRPLEEKGRQQGNLRSKHVEHHVIPWQRYTMLIFVNLSVNGFTICPVKMLLNSASHFRNDLMHSCGHRRVHESLASCALPTPSLTPSYLLVLLPSIIQHLWYNSNRG
ncbi:uncharacterized protein BDZ99DRAFT_57605 [Mytilinidion resinicola]|uniref:Uncharacterized protein n=1 Tax=Mytilinidion resinicola TaxID=574789 RepID=A0A6A6YKN6_9PEZI|nr:uncharacterized protein BDZ99DRAFT_57605 [Mytilinidion resinicola]KAF2808534.1 hypothetical protein BDZ99DRAFT_57605 [Mytilinidion resinicola]